MKKSNRILIIMASVLIVLVAAAFVVKGLFSAKTSDGNKQIEFTVVSSDGSEKSYDIKTDAEYLADALLEKKLINSDEYQSGFYTVIDGIKADYGKDGAWWCIAKGDEMTAVGMNEQPIEDGDEFSATYTAGNEY